MAKRPTAAKPPVRTKAARAPKPSRAETPAEQAPAAAAPEPEPLRDRYGPTQRASGRGRAGARGQHLAVRRGQFTGDALRDALLQRRHQLIEQHTAAQPAAPAPRARGRAMARTAPVASDPFLWLPIGPSVVLAGQAGGRPRVAGRVRDVAVSSDGRRIYAGSANGGVWYSDDAGESWVALGGFTVSGAPPTLDTPSGVLTCGCLQVRFDAGNNPALDEVIVGTGELTSRRAGTPGSYNGGVGVLRAVGPATGVAWALEGGNLATQGIYRIASDPAAPATLVAATSQGLFTRSGGPQAVWAAVVVAPFGGVGLICTDVLWVPPQGLIPARLYVALVDTATVATDVWVSLNGLAGPFNNVGVPLPAGVGGNAQRMSLAGAPSDASVVYVLGNGNTLWRIDFPAPPPLPAVAPPPLLRQVQRVPPNLLGGQDDYNQAIAVHPTRPERIVIGGATELADGQWSASLYLGNVQLSGGSYRFGFTANAASTVSDDSFIGHGVHADIHAARFVPVGAEVQLWIGCDGGLFRSLRGDDDNRVVKHSFISRNNGMATLQCGYLAGHPAVDGHLLAGTQDNGTIERIGVNLWRVRGQLLGDGGGVVMNPAQPQQFAGQYTLSLWSDGGSSGPGFRQPVLRNTGAGATATGAEKAEDSGAGFYSGADAVRVPGVLPAPDTARLAIGTHRVWFSPDWGRRWRTLPSLRDPMAVGGVQNTNVDPCMLTGGTPDFVNGCVVALRWATPARLYALCERAVLVFDLAPGPAATLGLSATRTALTVFPPVGAEALQAANAPSSPGQRLTSIGRWSDIAVQNPAMGPHGSFYVAMTGNSTVPAQDTLWWFDGTSRWVSTGLRNDPNGIPAPAYAVAVDPLDPNTVYVGTAVGVWRGTFSGAAGPWVWQGLNNGLPECAIEDLSLYRSGGVRLLRVAMQARGVWELDLASPASAARTFVRVHGFDTRRDPVTALTDPNSALPNTRLSWHASPDLRVRPQRGAPVPAPKNLPWSGAASDRYGLWVFQTALHARGPGDPLIKPNGLWNKVFEIRLRAATGSSRVTQAVWNTVVGTGGLFPDAYAAPWNDASPTEADLFELIVDRPVPNTSPASMGMGRVACQVDVQVHHRHTTEAPANDIRVALLMRPVGTTNAAAWAALPCNWAAAVQTRLRAGGATPALADGWVFADAANPLRPVPAAVDATRSRTVSFNIDLAGVAKADRVLLVAVVHSSADPVTLPPGDPLETLARGTRFVAVRSVEML